MQTPWVERPPAVPSMRRHGLIASQSHDSKYVPRLRQLSTSPHYGIRADDWSDAPNGVSSPARNP
jgi:hypothetical protein